MTQEPKPNKSCCCVSYERGISPCLCGCHNHKQKTECDHLWIVTEWEYTVNQDHYTAGQLIKFTQRKATKLICSHCSEVKEVGV